MTASNALCEQEGVAPVESNAMAAIRALFIDNGGVITDNSIVQQVFRRHVGGFLAERLGGEATAWTEANTSTFADVWTRHVHRLEAFDPAEGDVIRATDIYYVDWLRSMCSQLAIEGPALDTDCAVLAREINALVFGQARASFPGAIEALAQLSEAFDLYSASDGLSFQLSDVFAPSGIERYFRTLYGPDIVNTPKQSPLFYERIFGHAGIDPAEAVVVDDLPWIMTRAKKAGARAVLVSPTAVEAGDADLVIPRLADLPTALRELE